MKLNDVKWKKSIYFRFKIHRCVLNTFMYRKDNDTSVKIN